MLGAGAAMGGEVDVTWFEVILNDSARAKVEHERYRLQKAAAKATVKE